MLLPEPLEDWHGCEGGGNLGVGEDTCGGGGWSAGARPVGVPVDDLGDAPVQVGAYGEDVVPVLGGVDANAWIVAAGGHLLREGQLVAPVDRDNRPVLAAAAPAAAAK